MASAPPGANVQISGTSGMSRASTAGDGQRTLKKKAKKSLASFFGLDLEKDEASLARWDRRRVTAAHTFGKGIKPDKMPVDSYDSAPNIVDPLRASRQWSTQSTATVGSSGVNMRKKSVLQMTMTGVHNLSSARRASRMKKSMNQGQSFPPGSLHGIEERHQEDSFSLVDDVFYDEHPRGGGRPATTAAAIGPSAPGWRRPPPQAIPSTPGADQPDGFGLSRIKQVVLDTASNRDKRQMGMGVIGKLTNRRIRSSFITKDVKKQLDNLDDHRPYFTYWVTFVQVVVFIVAVAVYGIAPVGVSTTKETKDVKMPNLAIQTETHIQKENLWIGPRQADLIHLGAKYSPCMRVDINLEQAIDYDRAEERASGCCVRNDGGGCRQSVKSDCSSILSRWMKWDANFTSNRRKSGPVCGQDPEFCKKPASTPPFEWPDDITQWPICESTPELQSRGSTDQNDAHMHCDILGRPCCFGIQGQCIITTREHCDLQRGFFHDTLFLCSQVNCFEQICGMIPFAYEDSPDQFYRLWTSLFLHGGVVHLAITIAFQMLLMRDFEKLMGAIRIAIIYIGSGVAGNLASSTFIPYSVEVGPSGAQFGVAACLLVEVIQSWQMYRRPSLALLKVVFPLSLFFVLGLLPWFDNWAHMFGFLFGFLLAFALMPYVSFGQFDRRRKLISIIVCLGASLGLFTILVIIFYVVPITDCDWCMYLNCIPFTADFCENMQVTLKKNSTYSNFI